MNCLTPIRTIKRLPNELRRDDRIILNGYQARINVVLTIRPGVVQILALTEDGRLLEPVITGLTDCIVE